MKKVLVTGAAGTIGLQVIKFLLSEGKYEIAALDLKNNKTVQVLKKYKKRINVIYGDVVDRILIEALVKDFDIIIHLAGVPMPLADIKKDLANEIDYKACENIVRAIDYYNPKCHLFYASSMMVYKDKDKVTVKSAIHLDDYDYYAKMKKNCEDLIKEKLKNYTIYRFPMVLSSVKESLVLNGKLKENINWITKEDAAYSFVKGINYLDKLNKKTFNCLGGEAISYDELLNHILEDYGLSWKYVFERLFMDKYSYDWNCLDGNDLDELIHYQISTIDDYYRNLKKWGRKRKLPKFLGKLVRGHKL